MVQGAARYQNEKRSQCRYPVMMILKNLTAKLRKFFQWGPAVVT